MGVRQGTVVECVVHAVPAHHPASLKAHPMKENRGAAGSIGRPVSACSPGRRQGGRSQGQWTEALRGHTKLPHMKQICLHKCVPPTASTCTSS